MEDRPRRLTRRLATGLVVLALAGGWVANARADIAYAFATQTISNINITPTPASASNFQLFAQDGTTVNGSGSSNSAGPTANVPVNIPQAYQGGTPASGENNFARYAPGFPVPVSPVTPANPPGPGGSFTRGDATILNLFPVTNTNSVVAESYLNTTPNPGISAETGSAGLSGSFTLVPSSTGTLTISYNFSNGLYVWTQGASGAASANFQFNITIKDTAGNVLFNSAPALQNLSLSAPPNGLEIIQSGPGSVVTPSLTAGTSYTFILSSTAQSAVSAAAVPEPNVMMLVGVGAGLTLAVRALRRRTLRGPTT